MVIFIIWIVFILLQPKKNESRKEVCKIKDFCNIVIPFKETKILEFNKKWKSDKAPFIIIYAYLECLIEKIVGCKKISENSSITNLGDSIRLFNVYNIII